MKIININTFFCYITIFLFISSCKPEPTVRIPNELKPLEKLIQKETNDLGANFDDILEHEMENCEVNLYIYIYKYI
jgi:hypothetical protein